MLMVTKRSTLDRLEALSRTRPLTDAEVTRLERALPRGKFELWYWSKGDDRRLAAYLKRGKKPKQIAVLMNRTERAIWQRMTRKGLKAREFDAKANVQSPDDAKSGKAR